MKETRNKSNVICNLLVERWVMPLTKIRVEGGLHVWTGDIMKVS